MLAALDPGCTADGEIWRTMATLSGEGRHRAEAALTTVVADEAAPARIRDRAACSLATITAEPPEGVLARLRNVLLRPGAGAARLAAADALHQHEGLNAVRALRDDDREPAATRWKAAARTKRGPRPDRAAAVRVLDAIASNARNRPALRWRAARDLAGFGEHGRGLGCAHLRALAFADGGTNLARSHAAEALGRLRPDLRGDCSRLLRQLAATPNPLHRCLILYALGTFQPAEAARTLRAMADDRTLRPVVRLRCAEALAELRCDERDGASAVARELAHDTGVARHVRMTAARDLARWSALCRTEARELLIELHRAPRAVLKSNFKPEGKLTDFRKTGRNL